MTLTSEIKCFSCIKVVELYIKYMTYNEHGSPKADGEAEFFHGSFYVPNLRKLTLSIFTLDFTTV